MTDAELIARLRKGDTPMSNHYMEEAADRIEALTAENKMLRDAVYIDDLTVTMQASDRSKAIEGIGRALDLLNADMVVEAKTCLRATLAEIKGGNDAESNL